MDRMWRDGVWSTHRVSNNQEGWDAMELRLTRQGASELVARNMHGTEVPLVIVEELIAETRSTIKIR